MKYRTVKAPPFRGSITLKQAMWAARLVDPEDNPTKIAHSRKSKPVKGSVKSRKGASLATVSSKTGDQAKSAPRN
jgi:hypothetical protein